MPGIKFTTFALLGICALALPNYAATVDPKLPKQLMPDLKWLGSLTLSPQTVSAGRAITGTVVLLRNAIEDLTVSLSVDGATYNEAGVQIIDNVVAPTRVLVHTGTDHATFQITTGANSNLSGTKSYRITAHNGTESATATFSVSNGLLRKAP